MLKLVDLCSLPGRVYVGKDNGIAARLYFHLDELESGSNYPIKVIFPEDAKTMAYSFFLGMFEQSIKAAGSKQRFLEKYLFVSNIQIWNDIEIGIDETLRSLRQ